MSVSIIFVVVVMRCELFFLNIIQIYEIASYFNSGLFKRKRYIMTLNLIMMEDY